jgi:hypothetical protein
MRKVGVVFAIGVVAIGFVPAGCGGSATPKAGETPSSASTSTTTVAKGTWDAPAHYRFDYRPGCFCPNLPTRIEVRDGKVVKSEILEELRGVPGTTNSPTIDDLLADVARAKKEATGEVKVDYDDNGVPVEASIDWVKNAIDDEMTWRIENFTILP